MGCRKINDMKKIISFWHKVTGYTFVKNRKWWTKFFYIWLSAGYIALVYASEQISMSDLYIIGGFALVTYLNNPNKRR